MDLGPQGSKPCPACERERGFRLVLQYKVSHLWYVFKWLSDKQYGLVCEVCNRGEKLATQAVEAKLGKPKIPASSSKAWIFVVAGIACMIVFGLVAGLRNGEQYDAYLASPQKGDLYLANLSSLLKRPQSLEMYGVLRVRRVDGDRVEFDTPSVAYDKMSRAQSDMRGGQLTDATYFEGDPLALPRSEVAALHKHGVVRSVERPMKPDLTGAGQAKP
ncbi:hypothetical protein [Ramlibacter algicola]|uniref:Uncharacterized protein n=1 Tax=Ramlibacter algicola TaxID=2795217 RepID=A0A934Q5A1_9BURK|nr:hypothetical protein [Ramlibacter algicola]MBK0394881.1 hypothetical protein [Ramlibacter algicola]